MVLKIDFKFFSLKNVFGDFFSTFKISFIFIIFLTIPIFSFEGKDLPTQIALFGDAGAIHPEVEATRDSIRKKNIKNVFLLGDNLYDSHLSYSDVWDSWKNTGLSFLGVTIGNHGLGTASELSYFNKQREFDSFEIDGVRWIILNSNNESNADEQLKWAQSIVSNSQGRPLFLALHHPFVSVTDHHHWEEKYEFQKKFRSFVKTNSEAISGIFSGHDHISAAFDVSGIPLIISGAIFERLKVPDHVPYDTDFSVKNIWRYRGQTSWVRWTSIHNEVWIEFIDGHRDSIICSIKLFPKPIRVARNCH